MAFFPAHLHGAAACPSDTCGGTIPRRMCWRRPGGRSSVSLGPQSAGAALRCFAGRVCLLTCSNPFFLRFALRGAWLPISVLFLGNLQKEEKAQRAWSSALIRSLKTRGSGVQTHPETLRQYTTPVFGVCLSVSVLSPLQRPW